MYLYDPTFILLIPALLFSLWAQFKVSRSFKKYSKVMAKRGYSADESARRLLDMAGLRSVRIERVGGNLTDHYDPRSKVLRLSDSVSGSCSIAAIGVAAHEAGHAIQDHEGYGFLRFRNAIVPAVNLCSTLSMPLFFIGLIIGSLNMLNIGIALFSGVFVFHLVTLPTEFNASSRALKMLKQTATLSDEELKGTKAVLSAAALTYVAAMVMTIMQLLRLLALRNMRND